MRWQSPSSIFKFKMIIKKAIMGDDIIDEPIKFVLKEWVIDINYAK